MRIAVLIVVALSAAALAAEPSYVVIVHPSRHVSRLDRKFLGEVFLRRATRWPDDTPIRPIDLGPDAQVRKRFSEEILARSVESVRSYWQQRIFSGQGLPPPELPDDEAAWKEATTIAGEIFKDLDGKFRPGQQWALEVTDQNRTPLYSIRISSQKTK